MSFELKYRYTKTDYATGTLVDIYTLHLSRPQTEDREIALAKIFTPQEDKPAGEDPRIV
jgi:hypothetical protein